MAGTSTATTLDSSHVVLGRALGPGIYAAPVGTQATTADLAAPKTPWRLLGYLTEDGPKIKNKADSGEVMPWQGTAPVKQFIKSKKLTVEVEFIQWEPDTVALYFGTPSPTATASGFEVNLDPAATPQEVALLIVVKDGKTTVGFHLANTTVSDLGDVEMPKDDAMPLPVTLGASAHNGTLGKVLVATA